jgi:hypothetical protein
MAQPEASNSRTGTDAESLAALHRAFETLQELLAFIDRDVRPQRVRTALRLAVIDAQISIVRCQQALAAGGR